MKNSYTNTTTQPYNSSKLSTKILGNRKGPQFSGEGNMKAPTLSYNLGLSSVTSISDIYNFVIKTNDIFMHDELGDTILHKLSKASNLPNQYIFLFNTISRIESLLAVYTKNKQLIGKLAKLLNYSNITNKTFLDIAIKNSNLNMLEFSYNYEAFLKKSPFKYLSTVVSNGKLFHSISKHILCEEFQIDSAELRKLELHPTCSSKLISFCQAKHLSYITLLFKYYEIPFESLDRCGNSLLHKAAAFGDQKIVKALLGFCPDIINIQNKEGITALHIAAFNNHSEVVKTLISSKDIEPNLVSNDGNTALQFAINKTNRNMATLNILLESSKVAINVIDKFGNTLLHSAMIFHDIEMFKSLINEGADFRLINFRGQTPLVLLNSTYVMTNKNKLIIEKLVNAADYIDAFYEEQAENLLILDLNPTNYIFGTMVCRLTSKLRHLDSTEQNATLHTLLPLLQNNLWASQNINSTQTDEDTLKTTEPYSKCFLEDGYETSNERVLSGCSSED